MEFFNRSFFRFAFAFVVMVGVSVLVILLLGSIDGGSAVAKPCRADCGETTGT